MNVSIEQLLQIIGEEHVKTRLLEMENAALKEQAEKLAAEVVLARNADEGGG